MIYSDILLGYSSSWSSLSLIFLLVKSCICNKVSSSIDTSYLVWEIYNNNIKRKLISKIIDLLRLLARLQLIMIISLFNFLIFEVMHMYQSLVFNWYLYLLWEIYKNNIKRKLITKIIDLLRHLARLQLILIISLFNFPSCEVVHM